MKKSDIPQDKSNFTDLYYAVDDDGNYTTATSSGWDPKTIASDNAMRDINERIAKAKARVLNGETSPLEYFMEMHKMDLNILSSYAGIWKWRVRRHFRPSIFKKLPQKILKKYADVFDISIDQLKAITK
jgi:hypothetical protein